MKQAQFDGERGCGFQPQSNVVGNGMCRIGLEATTTDPPEISVSFPWNIRRWNMPLACGHADHEAESCVKSCRSNAIRDDWSKLRPTRNWLDLPSREPRTSEPWRFCFIGRADHKPDAYATIKYSRLSSKPNRLFLRSQTTEAEIGFESCASEQGRS